MDEQKSSGSVFGIVIVILVLIIGGIYLWNRQAKTPSEDTTGGNVEEQIPTEEQLSGTQASLETQSTSTELESIETDLNATSFTDL